MFRLMMMVQELLNIEQFCQKKIQPSQIEIIYKEWGKRIGVSSW